MKKKNIISLGLSIFMVIASLSATLGTADETEVTSDAGVSSSSAGIWYPSFGRFSYADGAATGTFVHFTFDENTARITDYTVKLTIYPSIWSAPYDPKSSYLEEYMTEPSSYKNKTIFTSLDIHNFSLQATPNAFSDYLIIQGKSAFVKCTDQDGGNLHIASGGQKTIITFVVPEGDEITQWVDDYYTIPTPLIEEKGGNGTVSYPSEPVPPEQDISPWQTIWIKSDNITTTISSYNGTVSIDGQTIVLELDPYGYLDIYTYVEYPAPPVVNDFWYNDLNITQDQTAIEEAKRNGVISAEGWVTDDTTQPPSVDETTTEWDQVKIANSASNNYYTYEDPTFEMTFNKIDDTGVEVIVNSEISTGRIVIINVDKDVLQTTSVEQLLVSFDDAPMEPIDTLQTLMEHVENQDATPSYYVLSGDQLTTLFVYVPHFSTHTISIKNLASGIGALSNFILPLVLSAVFISLTTGALLLQKKKNRDDL
jgi:hypothetical protein